MYSSDNFCSIFRRRPSAVAVIKGSGEYPNINGKVYFYELKNGVMVRSEILGLPSGNGVCDSPIFAFHIHSGNECTGNETDAFAFTGGHYNPDNCPHPYHAGDMPPLFSVNGMALSSFLTDRFTLPEILGKTVIIHSGVDDFTTQPSGGAGQKIACGVIMKV